MDFFEERLTYGKKAEYHFDNEMKENNIENEPIIEENKWNVSEEKNKELQKYDLENGDRLVNNKYKCDIKRGSISCKSLQFFKGHYFVIYNSFLTKCIVIEPKETKHINLNNYVILWSGDHGFKYEQLKDLKHITFENFIEKLKNEKNY